MSSSKLIRQLKNSTLKTLSILNSAFLVRVERNVIDLPALFFLPPVVEKDPDFWNNKDESFLKHKWNKNDLNKNVAKHVIYFLGDGMGISTLMASRKYKGGEGLELSHEKFPYSGLSKTYCTNTQVADSACSATSYLCRVKGNYGTIGLNGAVIQGYCLGQNSSVNHVELITKHAQEFGMRTDINNKDELDNDIDYNIID